MNVWHRAIKITLSATTAVLVAQLLGLENMYSAGIIALLSIFDTKHDSLQNAKARVLSTFLAFIIAILVFHFFGFSISSFGLYLLIYVPLAFQFGLEAGLSPCSVLVTHYLIAESISWQWVLNEFALMFVGVTVALVYNLWMPSQASEIESKVDLVELSMRDILYAMNSYLVGANVKISTLREKLSELEGCLNDLNEVVLLEYKNRLSDNDDYHLKYAQMRFDQYTVLDQIVPTLERLDLSTQANTLLADLFRKTADEFDELNTGVELLESIQDLYYIFRDSQLPQTRSEFENRALLYNVLIDFERFLSLKRDFHLEVDQEQG